jgi:hypothetical protein
VDGRLFPRSHANDEFNEPFYHLLCRVLDDKRVRDALHGLTRPEVFRVGVAMPESKWITFWRFPEPMM